MSATVKQLPKRSEVKTEDTWELTSLFPSDEDWNSAFQDWVKKIEGYQQFEGKLAESAQSLASCLEFDLAFDRTAERLGCYAYLRSTGDVGDSKYQGMLAKYRNAASRAGQAASFIRPEIMAIDDAKVESFLAAEELKPYQILLERILRDKPHTLSPKEEKLLAMQSEVAQTAGLVFRQLNNADLKFGTIENEKGETIELSHASFSACLHSSNRDVRKKAFHQYYEQYESHANTISSTLAGTIQKDVFYAQARNYPSALENALFDDNVTVPVYDGLIASVRRHLPTIYKYLDVRKRAMKLDELHQYDTYVPILSDLQTNYPWDDAVNMIMESLQPLGSEYTSALEKGLRGRWCDRYENQGKQAGAFSYGTFDSDPYILMNYQSDVLDHVFTLTHEAGHSMHSYYSSSSQPFQYYNYCIFVAEVASTFNEQLLGNYLMDNAKDDQMRAYLINREIDAIRGTLVRQTMFAEFEKITHAIVEENEPLTLDRLKEEYQKLLEAYFGPDFTYDDQLALECLRIPHFYRAFYVYQYATGISAAIALSERVLNGGPQELNDYLTFLKGGCSKYPLDLLRDAGVDLEAQPGPVDTALERLGKLVDELDSLLS